MSKEQRIIIASGPVIVEDGKVLLNQHGDTDFWKFCGGRVEDFGTDLIDNARREAREEMGIDLRILEPEPFLLFTHKQTESGRIDIVLAHFLAERIGAISPGADIREWRFIPLSELKDHKLGPNIIPTLEHFGFITKGDRHDKDDD